ncbi:MAG TPA: chromate transporter [Nitrospirota bacterium]|jgi:chromate transporter
MSLAGLFLIFFTINLFTVGGGYVMLPILHDSFVTTRHLLTEREFLDAVALGQMTPGPIMIMGVFIGYKLMGLPGAFVAALGTFTPSVVIATTVSKYYLKYKDEKWLEAVFRGIKPAVAGILLAVAIKLGQGSMDEPLTFVIGAVSFLVIMRAKADPAAVILCAGIAGVLFL